MDTIRFIVISGFVALSILMGCGIYNTLVEISDNRQEQMQKYVEQLR